MMAGTDSYVLSFVMAGGRGSRLEVLTKDRSKPAVSILGRYRIFDFVATNVENTGIPAMIVATQFEPGSLGSHVSNGGTWGFDGIGKSLELVYPHEEGRRFVSFEGTADSVRKNRDRIGRYRPNIILVLGGDHIYSMRYDEAIHSHERTKADITIMTNAVPENKVSDFGIVKIDETGRIIDFAEKPTDPEVIASFRLSPSIKSLLGIDEANLNFLASMGNYVFSWDNLQSFLDLPGVDFGKDIIPAIKENRGALYAHVFKGYWRDVGRIQDYFACNMEFLGEDPPINLLKSQIRSSERHLPSPRVAAGVSIDNAILSPGDVIHRGSTITDSVLGYQVVVEEGCTLDRCVLLGASRNKWYENAVRAEFTMRLGKGSCLSRVILDKNVWVGRGVDIGPHNGSATQRKQILESVGLKPYRESPDGMIEGDFCIEPETGILVIGRQYETDPKEAVLPDGLRC